MVGDVGHARSAWRHPPVRPAKKLTRFELRITAFLRNGEITVAEAAQMLGAHRGTVYRRCKAFGIDPAAARDAYVRMMVEAVMTKVAERIGRRLARSPSIGSVRRPLHEFLEIPLLEPLDEPAVAHEHPCEE
jgi:hypothetical protein